MALTLPTIEINVENPGWVGDEHEGGFWATPLSVSKEELGLPDSEWMRVRDLYVAGYLADARKSITAWFDEQRARETS